ncbi:hypothetical protein NLN82_25585 [Citrobacter portucalensis]|uniref:hypothetical protein n=1 Tax=Citrobacter portucalensis TaxID=1639133 RepID=UPI00226B94E6|nr:hypothetical protein [Citrobacter portucalensis]MCX9039383.1 hypothetical protein [Citrobacter portucalensis]
MNIILAIVIYALMAFSMYLLVSTLDGKYGTDCLEDSVYAVILGLTWPFSLLLGVGLVLMLAFFEWWDSVYLRAKSGNRGSQK